jgi:hypothetical protein
MVIRVRRKIDGLLRREGVRLHDEEESVMEPLDLFQAASIRRRVATSVDARAVEVVGGERAIPPAPRKKGLEAGEQGYSIHAAVRMKAADRKGREILLRYVLRPSFAEERMIRLPDGRVAYRFRRSWDDGSSHVILTPMEMMAKLAALVPPPRYHLVRYHGVLAPNSQRRHTLLKAQEPACGHEPATATESAPRSPPGAETPLSAAESVPGEPPAPARPRAPEAAPIGSGSANRGALDSVPAAVSPRASPVAASPKSIAPTTPVAATPEAAVEVPRRGPAIPLLAAAPVVPPTRSESAAPAAPTPPLPQGPIPARPPASASRVAPPAHARRSWAALMMRTLTLDVLKCPRCPGRMKVIACIDQPDVIEKFLRSAGLWTEPEPGGRGTATRANPIPEDSIWAADFGFPDGPPPDPAFD